MTHEELFLRIGRAYETPPRERTEEQRNTTKRGLCDACTWKSESQAHYDVIDITYPYWNKHLFIVPLNRRGDITRADLCYLFAAMGEETVNDWAKWEEGEYEKERREDE